MPTLPIAQPAEIGLDPRRLQIAYDLLEKWTTGRDAPVPGGAILVGRNGRIVEPRFFGRQGPEPDAESIRRDSMFLLASISKPLTYLGAMLLVERGELNLTDRVTRYISDFAAHHKEEMLVLHLFTHTSGMPDMLPNNVELRRAHAPLEKFVAGAIRDTVPLFPPGTNLSYQSMGTLIVAELVQRISGAPIDQFLKREIFDPLGMQSTALGSRGLDGARIVRVQVPGFQQNSDFDWNSSYWQQLGSPWGGVFSSPEDMAIVCQMLLNGGSYGDVRLLAPRTIERITTNRLDELPDLPEAVRRAQPWGLGWRMNHPGRPDSWGDLLGRHVYGHTGASGTMVWIDPQANGFCILFTSALREKAPWRLVQLSNAVAAAFVAA
jgi:CubicO group peptidase (beta-lactamase class C family)